MTDPIESPPQEETPEDGSRFVVESAKAIGSDGGHGGGTWDYIEWSVYDTTCPQLDGTLARVRIAICPTEDAARIVAQGLNLLVRAQASLGATVEAGRKARRHIGGNGKGGISRLK